MRELEFDNKKVVYSETESFDDNIEMDYWIQYCSSEQTDVASTLRRQGFVFHERILEMTIDLKSTKEKRDKQNRLVKGIQFGVGDVFTDEMRKMAYGVYTTDRRFHLKESFDQGEANKVIDAYVVEAMKSNCKILYATYNEKLAGFTIIVLNSNDEFENVLGVTENSIAGKMSAYALYSYMMNYGMDLGYKRYVGKVSTSNLASINLHIKLGALVTNVVDEFILRREEN